MTSTIEQKIVYSLLCAPCFDSMNRQIIALCKVRVPINIKTKTHWLIRVVYLNNKKKTIFGVISALLPYTYTKSNVRSVCQ